MSFSLLGLFPCVVPKNLFLEKIAPCRVPHARKFCEGAAQIKSLKMASENTFVNEDNIEFLSSVSLSSLKQAFAQNFIHSDSESGEISSSSDGSSNDFSDKSSSENASEMSYEESLKGSSSNKKKVFQKKRTASVGGNKPEDGPGSKKKGILALNIPFSKAQVILLKP